MPGCRQYVGKQIFWIRIPIKLRGTITFPEPIGIKLELYFIEKQIICSGTLDSIFVIGAKKKTGWVILDNFECLGQVTDPSKYENVLQKKNK